MPIAQGSETVTMSTFAPSLAASASPCCKPLSDNSEPSVAIRMRWYMCVLR